jgi:murein DD-endopeptidase MepM/ murein hydrolase activator NlpD
VKAGEVLTRFANTGNSSEPHLHFMVEEIDATGRLHMRPVQVDKLRTEQNQTVTAVPGTGIYIFS